ncbi:MAG TPA: hypothetical protein VLC50_05355 [Actinomycetes bacterium]|nr:hypothetical protein [Actinomycetes bacterium]
MHSLFENAVVLGIGVNIGGNNANYIVAVDGITFGTATGTTVFDFTDKNDCKAGGWVPNFPNTQFKNQGDCVSSLTSSARSAR